MFGKSKNDEPDLKKPTDKVLKSMDEYGPDSPEYEKLLTYLERFAKLKADTRKSKVSPDTMALVLGNLIGILIIVGYEQNHVITSKGLGFVMKSK